MPRAWAAKHPGWLLPVPRLLRTRLTQLRRVWGAEIRRVMRRGRIPGSDSAGRTGNPHVSGVIERFDTPQAPRCRWSPRAYAHVHERNRVDDLDRSHDRAQRQAVAGRDDDQAVVRSRDAQRATQLPARQGLQGHAHPRRRAPPSHSHAILERLPEQDVDRHRTSTTLVTSSSYLRQSTRSQRPTRPSCPRTHTHGRRPLF